MYNFTLYMTTDCNFKCQYCYEDYHNHYQLNEKTLVDSLEFMMNYGDRGKVLIDFLGGEPLLKKDLIYKAVAYIKDNYPEREVKYYITTNCSMMDDRFIAFMKENHFTVRLSFDGNKETHDLNRVAKDGVSCYEKIFENIMKVKDSGLNFSVRMTVTENTIILLFTYVLSVHLISTRSVQPDTSHLPFQFGPESKYLSPLHRNIPRNVVLHKKIPNQNVYHTSLFQYHKTMFLLCVHS